MSMLIALPEGAIPLAVGTALALGGLSLVLAPLIGDDSTSPRPDTPQRDAAARAALAQSGMPAADGAVEALREIEFDRETGKLSDSDYADLKQRYTQAAVDEMRALKRAAAASAADILPHEVLPVPARASDEAVSSVEHVSEADETDDAGDLVEAAIRRARDMHTSCVDCGPRPEPDADYCSNCGRYLARLCGTCGAPVEETEAHFCSRCGAGLGATHVLIE